MSQSTDSHSRIIYLKFETNKEGTFTHVGKQDVQITESKGKIIGFLGKEGDAYVYAPIGAHEEE